MALGPLALGTGIEPSGALGNQLSFLTRRSVLAKAICQIYNASPTIVGLLANSVEEAGGLDSIMANVQYQQMVLPQWTTFTANFSAPNIIQGIQQAAWAYNMLLCPVPLYLNELMLQDQQAIQDILELRMTDAGNAARDALGFALFNNVSATTQILGLPWLIDDGTNNATFGGITRAGNTWWQSKRYNIGAAVTRSIMVQYTTGIVKYQGEKPDFWVCGPATWALLELDFLSLERYIPGDNVTNQYMSGFTAVKVMDVPVYMDPYCAEGFMFGINCNYLTLRVHQKANWEWIDFQSMIPAYQLNYTGCALFLGATINTKPRSCGVLYNITGFPTL
jgi:hypothetical protein